MASADEYAAWIVSNADKKGTPEFETVAKAYQEAKAETKPAESKGASAMDRTNAAITGVNRGIAGLAGLPMDTVQNVYNLGKAAVGYVGSTLPGPLKSSADKMPQITRGTPLSSEWIAEKLAGAGINTANPRPDDAMSRMLHTGGTVVGGSLVPGARPVPTAAAAAGAAIAGEVSDNPLAPGLGAMLPGAARLAGSELRARIADPATVRRNTEAFQRSGAGSPTVGQATESGFFRGLESILSKFPGGQGVMRRVAERQQRGMGDAAETGVSAEDAGRAIETGIRGPGGFLERTQAVWQRLDNEVATRVGNPQIAPTQTLQTLRGLTTPTPGAENTTAPLINNRLAQIRQGLEADLANNPRGLPYQAIRQLRTDVGSMLEDALVSGVPQGQVRRVYGAISQDLEAAANAAGAGRQFTRQNDYYSSRMDRIETVLNRVIGNGKQPEDIFKAVMPTDPNQANKLRATLRSLPEADRQVVTQAVVSRLGRATPGRQNDVGDVFSSETFLTNWNRLSDGAKSQIFPDADVRRNINSMASVASNVREGSKVFANPSGTGQVTAATSLVGAAAGGAAVGSMAPAAVAGGLVLGANVSARMLTSPRVVNWLSQAARANPEQLPTQLGRLGVIFNDTKDEALKRDLSEFIQSVQ